MPMAAPFRLRARREELRLTRREFATLDRLATPQKIQAYVNAIPANHELGGETIASTTRGWRCSCVP